MCWAAYKKNKNAILSHLEVELNTLLPTGFLVEKANSCERTFLLSILREGLTYIAKTRAFFIMRVRENLKMSVLSGQVYRLVSFAVLQGRFLICTNRFDLTTL